MNDKTITRDEFIEHDTELEAEIKKEDSHKSTIFSNPFPDTLTDEQWRSVLKAMVKIIIGVILVASGYFLPRSQ